MSQARELKGNHCEEAAKLHKFIDPVDYLSVFVSHGARPDGRSHFTSRGVTLNIGSVSTANGSSMVRLGQTLVLAGIKVELSNPPLECSSKGYLVCNIDQTSSSLPETGSGPPSSDAQSLSQNLQDILSRYVDCEDLVLLESKLCWTLYVDVVCVCNCGNVWDACLLAATAALIDTRVPVVLTDSESPVVDISSPPLPLKLRSAPLAATFAVFNDDYFLLDPTHEEMLACDSSVSVVCLEDGSITRLIHTGKSISCEKLVSLCKNGLEHTQTLYKLLNQVCENK